MRSGKVSFSRSSKFARQNREPYSSGSEQTAKSLISPEQMLTNAPQPGGPEDSTERAWLFQGNGPAERDLEGADRGRI